VDEYPTAAVLSVRIEPTADASLAARRDRRRLGMAAVRVMDLASDWLELISPERRTKMLLRCRNPERRIASRRSKKYVRRTRRFETRGG
jgi:hypothetical protein